MECLAIADLFIDKTMMENGLQSLKKAGVDVEVRQWRHKDLESLQKDNIKLEQQGSEVINLSESLLKDLDKFDIIITQFAPIGKYVVDNAKNLKIIGVLRAGMENICYDYATSNSITVLNTPGRSTTSVSEFTIGMILAEMRNIARANHNLKNGKWEKNFPNGVLAPELKKSTVGLIGYGSIGKRVADLLRPFGCKIIFFDEYFEEETSDVQLKEIDDLVMEADVVSMHYRLTNKTENMLNKHHFNLMKKTAIVINTARSGLVNERDLIEALRSKKITGAAIDVYNQEPLPSDHPYNSLENITLTSHIAGSSRGNFADSPVILSKRIIEIL